jgi:hypothetical protein
MVSQSAPTTGTKRAGRSGRFLIPHAIAVLSVVACAVAVTFANNASAAGPPVFVQQVWNGAASVSTAGLGVAPVSNVTAGNRLVVLTEMWDLAGPTAASVADSAGNTYTRLLSFKGPDQAEMSVWTAPISAGGGTRPTVTVKPTSTAHLGFAVLEYSGLSTVNDASVVDQLQAASGTTGGVAATVGSGATAALTTNNALVLGLYVDSGFDATVTADGGYTQRVNNTPNGLSLFVEDRILSSGATPNATVQTGANTVWLMAAVALKSDTGAGGAGAAPASTLRSTDTTDASGNSGNKATGADLASSSAPANGGYPLFCLIRARPQINDSG